MLVSKVNRGKSGVYSITNFVNGKCYIGSSNDVYNRMHTHRNKLKYRRHSNKHLESAYHKYGPMSFIFAVVEYCSDYTQREQYFIDLLKPEYNKRLEAQNNKGLPVSNKTRTKISNTLKEKYRNGLATYKQDHLVKEIHQYTLDGHFVQKFQDSSDAAKSIGATRDSIRRACNRSESCKGFQWRVKNSTIPLRVDWNTDWGYTVIVTDVTSNREVAFNSIRSCSKHFGVTYKVIDRIIKRELLFKGKYRIKTEARYKDGELLENPEVDNQQPSITEM